MNFLFEDHFNNYKNNKKNIIDLISIEQLTTEHYNIILDYIINNKKNNSSDFRFFIYYVTKLEITQLYENIFNIIINSNSKTSANYNFLIHFSKYTTKKDNLTTILSYINNFDSDISFHKHLNYINHKINCINIIENF